jgi:hypothetical protein
VKFGVGGGFGGAEIGARDAIVPSQFIFVPLHPEEAEEKSAGGKHIARGAKQKLARRGLFAREIHDAKAAKHHAGSSAAKNGEQGEILEINDGERRGIDGGTELVESEVATKGAEECQEAAPGDEQAGGVNETTEAALVHGSDGIKAGVLGGGGGVIRNGMVLLRRVIRVWRKRDVNEHLRVVSAAGIGGAANGDGEGEVVGRGRLGDGYQGRGRDWRMGRSFGVAFEGQLGLAFDGRSFPAAGAVRREALSELTAPSGVGLRNAR